MGLFSWFTGSSRDSSEGQESERPSFLHHLIGTGPTMEAWRKQRQQVRKGYEQQVRQLQKQKPKQAEDFEESIEKQQESYMRRAGLPQFVSKLPTKEEMQENHYLKRVGERFEKVERRMRKNFYESQRDSRKDLKKQYHAQLKEISKELREGGLRPEPKKDETVSVTQHLMGRPQPSMPRQHTISPGRHFSGISRQHSSRV